MFDETLKNALTMANAKLTGINTGSGGKINVTNLVNADNSTIQSINGVITAVRQAMAHPKAVTQLGVIGKQKITINSTALTQLDNSIISAAQAYTASQGITIAPGQSQTSYINSLMGAVANALNNHSPSTTLAVGQNMISALQATSTSPGGQAIAAADNLAFGTTVAADTTSNEVFAPNQGVRKNTETQADQFFNSIANDPLSQQYMNAVPAQPSRHVPKDLSNIYQNTPATVDDVESEINPDNPDSVNAEQNADDEPTPTPTPTPEPEPTPVEPTPVEPTPTPTPPNQAGNYYVVFYGNADSNFQPLDIAGPMSLADAQLEIQTFYGGQDSDYASDGWRWEIDQGGYSDQGGTVVDGGSFASPLPWSPVPDAFSNIWWYPVAR